MKKIVRNAIKNNKERRLEADITTPTVRSLVSKIDEIHEGCSSSMQALASKIDEIPLSDEPIEPINGDGKNKLKK